MAGEEVSAIKKSTETNFEPVGAEGALASHDSPEMEVATTTYLMVVAVLVVVVGVIVVVKLVIRAVTSRNAVSRWTHVTKASEITIPGRWEPRLLTYSHQPADLLQTDMLNARRSKPTRCSNTFPYPKARKL